MSAGAGLLVAVSSVPSQCRPRQGCCVTQPRGLLPPQLLCEWPPLDLCILAALAPSTHQELNECARRWRAQATVLRFIALTSRSRGLGHKCFFLNASFRVLLSPVQMPAPSWYSTQGQFPLLPAPYKPLSPLPTNATVMVTVTKSLLHAYCVPGTEPWPWASGCILSSLQHGGAHAIIPF